MYIRTPPLSSPPTSADRCNTRTTTLRCCRYVGIVLSVYVGGCVRQREAETVKEVIVHEHGWVVALIDNFHSTASVIRSYSYLTYLHVKLGFSDRGPRIAGGEFQ